MSEETELIVPRVPLRLRMGLWIDADFPEARFPEATSSLEEFLSTPITLRTLFDPTAPAWPKVLAQRCLASLARRSDWVADNTKNLELALNRVPVAITCVATLIDARSIHFLRSLFPLEPRGGEPIFDALECIHFDTPEQEMSGLPDELQSEYQRLRSLAVRCHLPGLAPKSKLPADPGIVQPKDRPLESQEAAILEMARTCDFVLVVAGESSRLQFNENHPSPERNPILVARASSQNMSGGSRISIRKVDCSIIRHHKLFELELLNRSPRPFERKAWAREQTAELRRLGASTNGVALPECILREFIEKTAVPIYLAADRVAIRLQLKRNRAVRAVAIFAPLAVASVALSLFFSPEARLPAFVLEFLFLSYLAARVLLSRRRQDHERWLEFRFLAEQLRVAIVIHLCNLRPSYPRPLRYLAVARDYARFSQLTISELYLSSFRAGPLPKEVPAWTEAEVQRVSSFANAAWIGAQLKHHQDKVNSRMTTARNMRERSYLIFALAILTGPCHVAAHYMHLQILEVPLTAASLILPAAGAALSGYRAHMEYERLASRCEGMAAALSEIQENLMTATNAAGLLAVLREAEQLMTREVHGWTTLMNLAEPEAEA